MTNRNREVGGKVPTCGTLGYPAEYDFDSPYTLVEPDESQQDGRAPTADARIHNQLPGKPRPPNTTNAVVAFGDSKHVMYRACRTETGAPVYVDCVHGPCLRLAHLGRVHVDSDPQRQVSAGPCVVRRYYDAQSRLTAELLLNDTVRPTGREELFAKLTLVDPETNKPTQGWFWGDLDGTDRWTCVHYGKDGRKLRMERSTGQLQFFRGGPGEECLCFATCDPKQHGGRVSECYAGPPRRAYLTRATMENGDIEFHRGTVPQKTSVARVWHPDGRVTYYQGRRDHEVVTGTGFQPRTPDQRAPSTDSQGRAPLADARESPFGMGSEVRPTGLSRQDLNGRLGVVRGWDASDQRCHVQFGSAVPVRIRVGNLVTEQAYQEDRAARDATRSATARERADNRRARQLAQQQVRQEEARVAATLAAAAATPFDPRLAPPTAPAEHKVSLYALATCPVSHVLMADPVLASDGYVYDETALRAHWEEYGFLSPITGDAIAAFTLPHMPLRSLAMEIAASPTATKWRALPSEVPEILECPITHDLMEDPVRAADGNVYERDMLAQWFDAGKTTSPLYGIEMASELRQDHSLAAACRAWK